jgi:hypothetical protein
MSRRSEREGCVSKPVGGQERGRSHILGYWLTTDTPKEAPVEMMIAHPLVLPDTPLSVEELEAAVRVWGYEVQQRAFAQAWTAQTAVRPPVPCPRCQGREQHHAGKKSRRIETCFGPVCVDRQRRRCVGCGHHFQPDDALLVPALGRGRCTPGLRTFVASCAASWPYRQAAAVVGSVRGTPLGVETVRRIAAPLGAAVAAQHRREADAACTPPATAPLPRLASAPIEVVLDGAWIHSRDTAHGMEVKVGVVHTGREACGATRMRLVRRRYAATAQGIAPFAPLVTAMIDHVDGFVAAEQTVLGDGAAWIWRLGAEVLPDARLILDRWHLRDARRRALRAAVPDKAVRTPWSIQIEEQLEVGKVTEAVETLALLARQVPHPAVGEFARFLSAHAAQIPDYAARRAAGQTIGSGAVEKGVDVVVNRRMKGRRGMRWRRDRAEEMVALRVARLNDEWDTRLDRALTPLNDRL